MKMKLNYKITLLFVALLVQATTLMAQVPNELFGTYKGTAKTKLVQDEGKKVTNKPDKTFDVEIVQRNGDNKLVLKNFTLGNDVFEEVVFNNLDANYDTTNKRWNIFANPLGYKLVNKVGKQVEVFGLINDNYSFVYEGGKIELLFEIYTEAENKYEQDFTGRHTVATGIDRVTTDKRTKDVVYDLSGRHVTNPGKGVYIINGKKVLR
jgi:hypothetical protein